MPLIETQSSYPQNTGESGTGGTNQPKGAAGGALAGNYPNPELAPIAYEGFKVKNPKLENVAETYNLQFAFVKDGLVSLRGVAKVKAAEPILAKGIIGQITSTSLVNREIKVGTGQAGVFVTMIIKPNGEIETVTELAAGTEISFDGLTVST